MSKPPPTGQKQFGEDLEEGDEVVVTPAQAVQLAIRAQRQGHLNEAEQLYSQVLAVKPDDPDALHFLGVLEFQVGRLADGLARVRRSVLLRPDHPDFVNNLGNLLKEVGEYADAEIAYRRTLELRPDDADAWSNLGVALKSLDRDEEALEAYNKALEIAPEHVDALHNLGGVLRRMGKLVEAAEAYNTAIELRPFSPRSYLKLGALYYLCGELDAALKVYRRWQEQDPDSPIPAHMIASVGGDAAPGRASDAFVAQTFDGFANSFDHVLQRLEYQAPKLVTHAVQAELGAGQGTLDVLDAGCGTGLSGIGLAPYARHLEGVDLSAGMLAKAAERSLYQALIEAELTEYLAAQSARFDLIASADTLCYFGDLAPPLQAASRALRPGGLLVFTVEQAADQAAQGFALNPHGRYSHSETYVREVLAGAHFEFVAARVDKLRSENNVPVMGLVVTARLPR